MNGAESTRAERLSRYLDGELDAAELSSFETEMQSDHKLREELREWQTMRHRLKTAVSSRPVPSSLEAAVLAQTSQRPRFALPPRWRYLRSASVAAFCVLLLVSAYMLLRQHPYSLTEFPPAVAAMMEIGIGKHSSCVKERIDSAEHPLGTFQSEVPAKFKAMLESAKRALPADFHVVELHLCGSADREFAHLTLSDGKGYLSVLLTERMPGDPDPKDGSLAKARVGNVNIYAVREDGLDVGVFALPKEYAFVVSDLGSGKNLEFSREVAGAVTETTGARAKHEARSR